MRRIVVTVMSMATIVLLAACGDDGASAVGGGQGGSGGTGPTSQGGGGSAAVTGGGGGAGGVGGGVPSNEWSRFVTSTMQVRLLDLAATSDGGVVVAYNFGGTADFGGGEVTAFTETDLYLAKYDALGELAWGKKLDGSLREVRLAVGPGDVLYVVGSAFGAVTPQVDFGGGGLSVNGMSDAFLASFDAAGTFRWANLFGGPSYEDKAYAVAAGAGGLVAVAGQFSGTADFGAGPVAANGIDGFVVVFDADGAAQHSLVLDDGSSTTAYGTPFALALDGDGNTYVAGALWGTLNLGGLTSVGGGDAFVLKLDDAGAFLWGHRYGSADGDGALALAVDGLGEVVVAGSFTGSIDFGAESWFSASPTASNVFVARLNEDGTYLSSRTFGGVVQQNAGLLDGRADGALLLGGYSQGDFTLDGQPFVTGTTDTFAGFWAVLDGTNALVEGEAYLANESNVLTGAAFAADNAAFLGGVYIGQIELGGQPSPVSTASQAFLARRLLGQ